jgi:hypothetical protein
MALTALEPPEYKLPQMIQMHEVFAAVVIELGAEIYEYSGKRL